MVTLETSAPAGEPQEPPAMPVAALPYRQDDTSSVPLETKLVVLAAALHGAFGLLTFATNVVIYLRPAFFRTVGGGFRTVRSFEFAFTSFHVVTSVLVIVGAAALHARRPSCRPLLMAGSVGMLVNIVLGFAYYLFFVSGRTSTATAGDRVVMSVWQGGGLVSAALLPVLLLVAMTRPVVQALFKKPG